MSILQPIYNELIVRMYSVLFLFENPRIVLPPWFMAAQLELLLVDY